LYLTDNIIVKILYLNNKFFCIKARCSFIKPLKYNKHNTIATYLIIYSDNNILNSKKTARFWAVFEKFNQFI